MNTVTWVLIAAQILAQADEAPRLGTYHCKTLDQKPTITIDILADSTYVPSTGGYGNYQGSPDSVQWIDGPLAYLESSRYFVNERNRAVILLEGDDPTETEVCTTL